MPERATARVRRSSASSSLPVPSVSSVTTRLCSRRHSIHDKSSSSSSSSPCRNPSLSRHSFIAPLCLATILTLFIACGRIASADAAATAISANAPLTITLQPRQTWRYFTFDNAGVCFHRCDANHEGVAVVILFSFQNAGDALRLTMRVCFQLFASRSHSTIMGCPRMEINGSKSNQLHHTNQGNNNRDAFTMFPVCQNCILDHLSLTPLIYRTCLTIGFCSSAAAASTTTTAKQAVHRTHQCRTEWRLQRHWRRSRPVCVTGTIIPQNPIFSSDGNSHGILKVAKTRKGLESQPQTHHKNINQLQTIVIRF
jgi:hypothetical protein